MELVDQVVFAVLDVERRDVERVDAVAEEDGVVELAQVREELQERLVLLLRFRNLLVPSHQLLVPRVEAETVDFVRLSVDRLLRNDEYVERHLLAVLQTGRTDLQKVAGYS